MNSVPKIGFHDHKQAKPPARPGAPNRRSLSSSPPPLFRASTSSRDDQGGNVQEAKSIEDTAITAKMVELSTAIDEAKVSIPQLVVGKTNRALTTKKREFVKLKKQVIAQQNALIEQLAVIKEMETRAGLPPDESVGEVSMLTLNSWPAHDLLLLVRDVIDTASVSTECDSFFATKVLQKMSKLRSLPEMVQNLCSQLTESRNSYIATLKQKNKVERHSPNTVVKTKTDLIEKETEKLNGLVKDVTEKIRRRIDTTLKLAKLPWIDREILIKRLEKLQKENNVAQTKLNDLMQRSEGDLRQGHADESQETSNNDVATQELAAELNKERLAREALKEVVSAAENMLRVARARVSTLEKQLKDVRTELDVTKRKLKDVATFHRQRENSIDARSKKLLEVSKTGELTIETLSRQRDALELRVKELHEQAISAEKAAEQRFAEEKILREKLQLKVTEQEKDRQASEARSEQLASRVMELETELTKLREYSRNLVDVTKYKCLDYIPVKERDPSYGETQLWEELQLTKEILSKREEELQNSRAEKEKFLQSLYNIAQGEADDREDKLAAALVEKEKKISEMHKSICSLKERLATEDELKTKFRGKITALRMEVCRLRHYDCYAKDISYQDLQNELLELYMRVESLSRERAALVSTAASRSLMLERQEKAVELFARMTRARHELAAHLEGRPVEIQDPDIPFSDVTRSLSYLCTNAAGAWNALRAERSHVFRLETAVLSQNEQLEREARVRIELEQRRASLERELARCHAILDGHEQNYVHM